MSEVYLDYAASTPCAEPVVQAMLPFFRDDFGNPANLSHDLGVRAYEAVERARGEAAAVVGCLPHEVLWTSGATEANNLAILGAVRAWARAHAARPGHLVTARHEHKSVLAPCVELEREGVEVSYLAPRADGVVTAAMVEAVLRPDTVLVTVMWANNELGTVNEVPAIAALCRERGILCHADGTQWVGRMPTDLAAQPLSLLTWSSHKLYGPKGVGALFVRSERGVALEPLLWGGGQERGLRSGTLNVPAIVGFGAACALCGERMEQDGTRIAALRDRLEALLLAGAPGAVVNGSAAARVPHISSITFPLEGGPDLVKALTGVACSSGSACESQDLQPSHVLRSIGIRGARARSTLRLSLGRPTSESDVDTAAERILETVRTITPAAARAG